MTEGVTNVIVKGSGRNGVVMETTTKCLCDLVQLAVPMATGLILEHLSVKVRLVSSSLPSNQVFGILEEPRPPFCFSLCVLRT